MPGEIKSESNAKESCANNRYVECACLVRHDLPARLLNFPTSTRRGFLVERLEITLHIVVLDIKEIVMSGQLR